MECATKTLVGPSIQHIHEIFEGGHPLEMATKLGRPNYFGCCYLKGLTTTHIGIAWNYNTTITIHIVIIHLST